VPLQDSVTAEQRQLQVEHQAVIEQQYSQPYELQKARDLRLNVLSIPEPNQDQIPSSERVTQSQGQIAQRE
jgi:hypothetical protein